MLLRLLEALLELANARLIAVFEVFYFIANFLDFRIVRADGRNGCDKGSADGGCQGDFPEHENLLWTKKIDTPRQGRGRQRRRSEEKRGSAAVERGNRARTEDIVRRQRLRKDKVQRSKDGDAGGRHTGDLFEADALVAQFRMSESLLRRRFLAQMGNCMRVSRLLCEKQQQDQQAVQDAMQSHGFG